MSDYNKVLNFWFGPDKNDQLKNSSTWFQKNEVFDQRIKKEFEELLEQASMGELQEWKEKPHGRLGYIILIDQFSRNIYRNNKKSFENDHLALSTCLKGIEIKADAELTFIERMFFYMPMMHSEQLAIQEKCVAHFETLTQESPENLKQFLSYSHEYAIKHYDIVKRFNRFPHRNKILERESTEEEVEFLKQPGSSF